MDRAQLPAGYPPVKRYLSRLFARVVRSATRIQFAERHRAYSERWHPRYALQEEALADTVAYIKGRMPDAMIRQDAYGVLSYAARLAPDDGLIVEFGVRTGKTINHIANAFPDRRVFGFDSFEGLPEDWTGWVQEAGTFGGEGLPNVRANVELVKGLFADTLPGFLEDHPGWLALAHVDSDLYSSAKTVLDAFEPRIRPGSIIVFNEYFNYPNWRAHEFKAFQEFCANHEVAYEYLCWGMYEVAVRITARA